MMPWQPWHWAILFSIGICAGSAACTQPAAARKAAASILEGDIWALSLLLEFGSRKLYRTVLLEERLPRAGRREVETLPHDDADLHQLAGDFLGLHVFGDGLQAQ